MSHMVLPKALARFNRYVTNPLARSFAWLVPPFAVVIHRGRVTSRERRTPVMAFRAGEGMAIALTYGSGADWVRNVMSAGGCTMRRAGRLVRLAEPRLVTGVEGRKMMPLPVRTVLRALNVTQFLQLRDVTRDPQRSRRPG